MPLLLCVRNINPEFIGDRDTFAVNEQTISDFNGIYSIEYSTSIFGTSQEYLAIDINLDRFNTIWRE
ncbi:hypothetical protein [Francisella tularensis]|uniref:hypothetical protein n=1 Tax=Francisella tularensis TaxID=263 RepID=UPI0017496638|nr:hypothetical protein [Francisella tularensis]MBD5784359.1 hypothetical protein [Francisella tularensis subsp. holarctica]